MPCQVILHQPQIPQNTGNIVRTCKAYNADLILVRPLGFSTSSRMLKRAGLDYWDDVKVEEIDDLESYLENCGRSFYFFSSKAQKNTNEAKFNSDSILIFGSETTGLPEKFWNQWPANFITIPMITNARCLNLSNAVAIGIYEMHRQLQFREKKQIKQDRQDEQDKEKLYSF